LGGLGMSLDLIRYYFYLEEDADSIAVFQSELKKHDIFYQSSSGKIDEKNLPDKSYFLQFKNNNINILVVRLSSESSESLLQNLETSSLLTTDNLLGKVTVWAAYGEDTQK
jgi:hypothetical protein